MSIFDVLSSDREPIKEEVPEEPIVETGPWTLALLDIFDKSRQGPSMDIIKNAENLFRTKPRIPSAYRRQEEEKRKKARRVHIDPHEEHMRRYLEFFDRLSKCKKIHLGNYNAYKSKEDRDYLHISDEFLYVQENLLSEKELAGNATEHHPLDPARRETGRSNVTSPKEPYRIHERRLIKLRRKSDSSTMAGGISKLELKVQYLPDEVKFVHHGHHDDHRRREVKHIRDLRAFKQPSKNNLFDAVSAMKKATIVERMHARATTMIMERMTRDKSAGGNTDKSHVTNNPNPLHHLVNFVSTPSNNNHLHVGTPMNNNISTPVHIIGAATGTTPMHTNTAKDFDDATPESKFDLRDSRTDLKDSKHGTIKLPILSKDSVLSVISKSRPGSTSPAVSVKSFNEEKMSPPDSKHQEVIESESEPISPELKKDLKVGKKISSFMKESKDSKENASLSPEKLSVNDTMSPSVRASVLKPYRLIQDSKRLPQISAVVTSKRKFILQDNRFTPNFSNEPLFSLEASLAPTNTIENKKKKKKMKRSQTYTKTIHENIRKIPEIYLAPSTTVHSKGISVFLFDKKSFNKFKPFKYQPMEKPERLVEALSQKSQTPQSRLSTPFNNINGTSINRNGTPLNRNSTPLNRNSTPMKPKTPLLLDPLIRISEPSPENLRPKRPDSNKKTRPRMQNSSSAATLGKTNISNF